MLVHDLSLAKTIEWLREGHRRLREHIASLEDEELAKPRRLHWGEMRETRGIIRTLVNHDLYHAGEINHLRALLRDDDRWPGA